MKRIKMMSTSLQLCIAVLLALFHFVSTTKADSRDAKRNLRQLLTRVEPLLRKDGLVIDSQYVPMENINYWEEEVGMHQTSLERRGEVEDEGEYLICVVTDLLSEEQGAYAEPVRPTASYYLNGFRGSGDSKRIYAGSGCYWTDTLRKGKIAFTIANLPANYKKVVGILVVKVRASAKRSTAIKGITGNAEYH